MAAPDRGCVKTRQCHERTNVGRSDRAVCDSFVIRRGRMTPQFEIDPRFYTASTLSSLSVFIKADGQRMRSTGDRGGSRESCDLLATSHHWITSSARTSSDCGIVRPSAFAVFRLMTSSNFVGCSIGRSPGFPPLSILSTKLAAFR